MLMKMIEIKSKHKNKDGKLKDISLFGMLSVRGFPMDGLCNTNPNFSPME